MYRFCEAAEVFAVITLSVVNPSVPFSLCFTNLLQVLPIFYVRLIQKSLECGFIGVGIWKDLVHT